MSGVWLVHKLSGVNCKSSYSYVGADSCLLGQPKGMCYIGVLKADQLALRIYTEQQGTDRQGVASHSYVYDQLNRDKEARIENAPIYTQGSVKEGHIQLYNACIWRVV